MYNPKISIIVPVYNVEKYLDRCVESIVNQTYKNLEIILVDDGSPDNCPAMCDEWSKKDSRIIVVHKENGGISSARNSGLSIAAGDYIGFVDSDDYVEPNTFDELFTTVNDCNADISVSSFFFNNTIQGFGKKEIVDKTEVLKNVSMGEYKYGVIWNKLYKRTIIDGVEFPELVCSEDLVYNYFAFKNANTISVTDKPLYHYSQNEEGTILGKFSIGAFDAIKAKQIILDNEKENNILLPYIHKGLISSAFVVLSGCIQNDMFKEKQKELISLILIHKKEILSSSLYTFNDKTKTVVLSVSPSIYSKLIKRKYSK